MDIDYWRTASGKSPVQEFILESKNPKLQDKFMKALDFLEEVGVYRMPKSHIDLIDKKNKIFELRIIFENIKYRILFFVYYNSTAVLLSYFIKSKGKTPLNEIDTAIKRKRSYLDSIKS